MSGTKSNEYSIGAVAGLTGLSTQVIRAWERRYSAVVAARSSNGRRIYKPEHVDKLLLLKSLTERGSPISAIANLDADTLRARAAEMDQIAARPLRGNIRVAALGAFLPDLLNSEQLAGYPLERVASAADPKRLAADLVHANADVLVVEMSHLDPSAIELVGELVRTGGTAELVVAYGFGRRRDEKKLLEMGARLLKTPVTADELALAVVSAMTLTEGLPRKPARAPSPDKKTRGQVSIPTRRYSEQQLVFLASIDSGVDCECPRQVAEILKTLTAFETYSAECENANEQDAALHAFLHQATAQSRALMEQALDRLVEVEQIKI